jgi:biotin-(acetyl-CoA carboxylase) ligase
VANDLITAQGKLGGILIEMRAEAAGPVHVVVGLGINVMLDQAARSAIAATGNIADDICARHVPVPDRNAIVAALLARLIPALEEFPRAGLTPHLASWECERCPCRTARCASKTRAKSRAAWHAASTRTAHCWWKLPTVCGASFPAR